MRYSRPGRVAGVPCRLLRIGFVGETGWEIHYPADAGTYLWDRLLAAGLKPFGVEAQRILRLEKRHIIVGVDTDSLSNPLESGMGWAVKFDKEDFVGKAALTDIRSRPLRQSLVGFTTANGTVPPDGSAIVIDGSPVGRVTSCRFSPYLGKTIGLGWVPAERAVSGQGFGISVKGNLVGARIVEKAFYDPEGLRLRA